MSDRPIPRAAATTKPAGCAVLGCRNHASFGFRGLWVCADPRHRRWAQAILQDSRQTIHKVIHAHGAACDVIAETRLDGGA